MIANEKQIGGDHYKTTGDLQHWDLFGPEYLVGCATKYVSRWRRKGGNEDLEKALHYTQKLKEGCKKYPKTWRNPMELDIDTFNEWVFQSDLNMTEQTIIVRLIYWNDVDDIDIAIELIKDLINGDIISAEIKAREQWRDRDADTQS